MKQGAYHDIEDPTPSWAILMMNFFMESMDDIGKEGSYKPLNVGIGWYNGEDQESGETDTEETCSCKKETDIRAECQIKRT